MSGNYSEAIIEMNGETIQNIKDNEKVKVIVYKLNSSKREYAAEMSFTEEPELKLILKSDNIDIKMGLFEKSGNVILNEYYIHTQFNFE